MVPEAVNYFNYWKDTKQAIPETPKGLTDLGYYSFDMGSWHLIALNSECAEVGGCDAESPEYRWLKQDLGENKDKKCSLAFYHKPVFSSGTQASDRMKELYSLLYLNDVDIVLNGHEHDYERFAPQGPDGSLDLLKGIREFVVGTGGASNIWFDKIKPNSEARNDTTPGALKLTLGSGSYEWQFIPINGGFFHDSGNGMCH